MNNQSVGVAHQYKIRIEKSKIEKIDFDINDVNLKNISFEIISKKMAKDFIIEYEWLKTIPHQTRYHFGLFFHINNKKLLGGVLIFSDDYAQNTGVWNKYDFGNKLILLSRGASMWWTPKNTASFFITKAIKWLKANTHYRIITATVDPNAGEIGTIYQSLNWKYVGLMNGNYSGGGEQKRFSVLIDGKLRYSRSIRNEFGCMKKDVILKKYPDAKFIQQYRKRRYFYFFDSKHQNKIYNNNIKHLIMPYPKRNDNCCGIIYKITNIINNKIYIGQTVRGFSERITEYKNGQGNVHLNNSFNKYGFENFKFEIIKTCTSIDELNKMEITLIEKYDSTNKNKGYNIECGGLNSHCADETRRRMSIAHKGIKQNKKWVDNRIPIKGSDEAKKHGRVLSEEEKIYLSENSPKFWLGKKRDIETIEKIKETKRNNGLSEKKLESLKKQSKIVCCETNNIITKYDSIAEASRITGISTASISRYIKTNKIVNGVKWFTE